MRNFFEFIESVYDFVNDFVDDFLEERFPNDDLDVKGLHELRQSDCDPIPPAPTSNKILFFPDPNKHDHDTDDND